MPSEFDETAHDVVAARSLSSIRSRSMARAAGPRGVLWSVLSWVIAVGFLALFVNVIARVIW